MTRKDSVRAATGTAKDSVRHAAEVVAPYAGTAKDAAVHFAHEARTRAAPKVAEAAHQARAQYDTHLHPRIEHARGTLPPKVDAAATRAACRTRKAARQAADYTAPRLEHAVTHACRGRTRSRGSAGPRYRRARRTPRPGDGRRDRQAPEEAQPAGQVRQARQAPRRAGHPGRRCGRRLEVVGQAGQPGLAGRAAGPHRGQRPRTAERGRRQRGRLARPRCPGQAGRGGGRRTRRRHHDLTRPPQALHRAVSPPRTRGGGHGPFACGSATPHEAHAPTLRQDTRKPPDQRLRGSEGLWEWSLGESNPHRYLPDLRKRWGNKGAFTVCPAAVSRSAS